uniref:Globin family profile domain-containing protein n=1 Tax=Setaria digitata TaxID=48799 RepID=A0A915PVH2_9BILA
MGNVKSASTPAEFTTSDHSPLLQQLEKVPLVLRRRSAFSVERNDFLSLTCSSGCRKDSRSHSENRRVKQDLADSDLETLSFSCSNLRQALQPYIEISGDLTTSQNSAVRRLWKQVALIQLRASPQINEKNIFEIIQEMKRCCENECELASRLLLHIFAIDSRLQAAFYLPNVPYFELRNSQLFEIHVKVLGSTLSFIMLHLHDPTAMSKSLQALGARHVIHTKVQYRSNYWKVVNQAFIEFVNADRTSFDMFDAWNVLGNFCVEQMRIGYKIEYKAQKVLERFKAKDIRVSNEEKKSFQSM